MENHYASGNYNFGMGCVGSKTPSEIRKDFDFAGQQENVASTESMSDSQFPPYSTQRGVDNITLTNEAMEESDYKRVPWSVDDDKMLASVWLTISNCSIVGNSQNNESFWKRVTDCFNENRQFGPPRKYKAVKSHWHWLSRMVNEFNQYYNKLVGEHHSGWNDDQIKQYARELFHQNKNKHFLHEHVWVLLKNDPKWKANTPMQRSSKKVRIDESGAYTSSSNADSSFDIDDSEVREVRPLGQKTAKKGKRKGKSKKNEQDVGGELSQIRIMLKEHKEEKLQAMENLANKLDNYNFRSDYEILLKDTTGMSEQQLKIHEHMCSILKAKYNIS
ncbi:glutathione S-transferase T3-like [Coffea arabica]|uniref:Glutathione S-transferase T3-like n=1 Tax=Coffea arabica TaxID=13443 RepID=A0A6P6W314_COFAR|nr:glutathione S-transferase T3-like [Coffea arabica]